MHRKTSLVLACTVAAGTIWSLVGIGESADLESGSEGRFEATAVDGGAILLDRNSGLSWYLKSNPRNASGKEWVLIARELPPKEDPLAAAIDREAQRGGEQKQLKEKLVEAEIQYRTLLDQYGSSHPRVLELKRRIELLKQINEPK